MSELEQIKAELDQVKLELRGALQNMDYSINLGVAMATEKLTKERDEAQKACAEMRNILGRLGCGGRSIRIIPLSDRPALDHALSTDCGKGYFSREQVMPLMEAFRGAMATVEKYCGSQPAYEGSNLYAWRQALAHAEAMMKEER